MLSGAWACFLGHNVSVFFLFYEAKAMFYAFWLLQVNTKNLFYCRTEDKMFQKVPGMKKV